MPETPKTGQKPPEMVKIPGGYGVATEYTPENTENFPHSIYEGGKAEYDGILPPFK